MRIAVEGNSVRYAGVCAQTRIWRVEPIAERDGG